MSTYTDYADDTTGNTLYAKPEPLVTSPWGTDKVVGTENGSTGSYAFTLDSDLSYVVYRQAGASAASTDLKLGRFSPNVKPKTDLIGTGAGIATAPVSSQGRVTQIFRGDDYLSANGRAFQWTITEPTNFTAATATCTFGGSDGTNTWLVSGTITDQGSTWLLSFDMTKTDTAIPAGNYDWTVEVKSSTGVEHTVSFGGDTRVRRKYT